MSIEIPGYTILGELGSGAMGAVYLALQESLQRQVALKVMDASLTKDESFRERFFTEGRIVAQLKHPNIVTVHDIGQQNGHYYMGLEYASGGSLAKTIRQSLPEQQAVELTANIAGALAYAHARNFVHRDIKPANILFREDGTALLSDFGIAKCLSSDNQLTVVGMSIGTPNYMSPEQAMGQTVTPRSDLYSLGVSFYEMLTGERPYKADSAYAVAAMHVNAPLPVLPEAYSRYQPVIEGCMAKDPSERFESGEALIVALHKAYAARVDDDRTIARFAAAAPPPGSATDHSGTMPHLEAQSRQYSPAPRFILAGTVALALGAAGIGAWYWHNMASSPPTTVAEEVAVTRPESLLARHFTALESLGVAYHELANVQYPKRANAFADELRDLGEKLASLIEKAQATGNAAFTHSLLERALKVLPDSTRLTDLGRALQHTAHKEVLTTQQKQRTQRLLDAAERNLSAGRFTIPDGANAFELFQRVLVIDPHNARANRGLQAMANVFEQAARDRIAHNDLNNAAKDIEIGLMIHPTHQGLRSLSREFTLH